MNEQDYNQWRELSWQRPLTPAETVELEKYLAAHPSQREEWQADLELSQLLEKLPAAPPVASNFTARVLQAVELEKVAQQRARVTPQSPWQMVWRWLPKTALAALVLGVGTLGYNLQQVRARTAMAENAAQVSAAVAAYDPQMLEDFEPIRRLSDSQPKAEPRADVELIALLQ